MVFPLELPELEHREVGRELKFNYRSSTCDLSLRAKSGHRHKLPVRHVEACLQGEKTALRIHPEGGAY